ncbi:glycosyltransferase family 39 protein [Salinadaptatus halalkaliphilus]|uniref:glycosyltransferase family 39 protein n=1 Tax=Salinadaptatus halalkaliphilus TaxID=2419781 RepID=UPI0011438315|nr:glycosyltransferase family 39 protein [Salinadaptatus halalkaliphilus]
MLYRSPAPGFLPSIYHGVPVLVWGCLAVAFGGLFVCSIYPTPFRYLAFGGGFMAVFVLFVLPYIRTGLPYGRGDVLAQLGTIRVLEATGSLDPGMLTYPFTHLGVVSIAAVTELPNSLVVTLYLPAIVSIYVAFIYLTSRLLSDHAAYGSIAVFLALLPMFNEYSSQLMPNGIAMYLFIPLVYVLARWVATTDARWGIAVVTITVAMVIAHPLVGFLLIHVLLATTVLLYLAGLRSAAFVPLFSRQYLVEKYVFITLFFAFIYVEWYLSVTIIWQDFFESIVQFVRGIDQPVTRTAELGTRTEVLTPLELLELLLLKFGGQLFVAILTAFGVALFVFRAFTSDRIAKRAVYLAPALLWLVFSAVYLFIGIVAPEATFPPLRFVAMVFAPAPLFAGYFLYDRYRKHDKRVILTLLVLLIVFLFTLQAASFYDGSHTTGASGQQTDHELEGVEWALEYKDEDIAMLGFEPYRYEQSILGPETVREDRRSEFPRDFERHGTLPGGLTTDEDVFITEELGEDRYVQISRADYIQGIQTRLTAEDEAQLAQETDRIYSNGQYRVYLTTTEQREFQER